ncbi:hypothetical protein BH09SUM1_BH09SUM1_20320 [soil metagenome]
MKSRKKEDVYTTLRDIDLSLKSARKKRAALLRASLALVFVQAHYKEEFEKFLSGELVSDLPTKEHFMRGDYKMKIRHV